MFIHYTFKQKLCDIFYTFSALNLKLQSNELGETYMM